MKAVFEKIFQTKYPQKKRLNYKSYYDILLSKAYSIDYNTNMLLQNIKFFFLLVFKIL